MDNPNPARITDASWRFSQELLVLEHSTTNGGTYVNKPGYHGTRAENIARDGVDGDYSVRHPLDKLGPDDKTAGYDWVFPDAQDGDYRTIAKYGKRVRAAYDARDLRLYGWREVLGQTDTDTTPEGLDFDGWYQRTPDPSHSWHKHFSEHRAFVASWDNKLCMLSVLSGESLVDYLARGGKLMKGANMATSEEMTTTHWRVWAMAQMLEVVNNRVNNTAEKVPLVTAVKSIVQTVGSILALVQTNGASLTDALALLKEIRAIMITGQTITLSDADRDDIARRVADRLTAIQFVPRT